MDDKENKMKTRRSQKIDLPNCSVELEEIPENAKEKREIFKSPKVPEKRKQSDVQNSLNTLKRIKRKNCSDSIENYSKKPKVAKETKEVCDCEKVGQEEFFRWVERYCPDDDESYAQCLLDMCHFYKFGEHVMHDLINAKKKIFVLEMQVKKLTGQKPAECCKEIDSFEQEICYDSEDELV